MTKRILITGHSKGIGAALTQQLLEQGYEVLGIARTQVAAHPQLTQWTYDLSKQDEVLKLCERLSKEKLDVVVLNAGWNDIRPAEAYTPEEILQIATLNFATHAAIIRATISALLQTRGWIIGVGSFSAMEVARWNNYYGASKAALQHLLQNIFEQYRKQGLKVTTIVPDITQTNFYKHQQFEPTDDAETFLTPEEVAHVISGFIINKPAYVPSQVVLRPQRFELRRKK